jgi:hypothetical protein
LCRFSIRFFDLPSFFFTINFSQPYRLQKLPTAYLGRCPRLLQFQPFGLIVAKAQRAEIATAQGNALGINDLKRAACKAARKKA